MESFYSLYDKTLRAAVKGRLKEELSELTDYDEHHLECLLHPEKEGAVCRVADCSCPPEEKASCEEACAFDAMKRDERGQVQILPDRCVGCAECIERCKEKSLADRKDILPVFELLNSEAPVYAMIAPAFTGQFGEAATPGRLRTAFKMLGFEGMLEVALFADILTLKEALEFDRSIHTDEDFQLTSCCCPIWIAMIRNIYDALVPHVPPSVSPMAACGRAVKKLYPNAKTVFIGPCIAKKAEAREADIKDSVDYVLTFQEMETIFEIAGIDPASLEEDFRDHSSTGGRIYARTGGVSEAVQSTLNALKPNREIPLRAKQANGAAACKALLNEIKNGSINANFIEGMGCVGGCVGGPKAILDRESGTKLVNAYGELASYETPADNPFVLEMLHTLGFDSIDSLLEGDNLFTRDFSKK